MLAPETFEIEMPIAGSPLYRIIASGGSMYPRRTAAKEESGISDSVLPRPSSSAPAPRDLDAPDMLEGSMRALEIELAPEALHRLDVIFPGPGGQAPEAYAW